MKTVIILFMALMLTSCTWAYIAVPEGGGGATEHRMGALIFYNGKYLGEDPGARADWNEYYADSFAWTYWTQYKEAPPEDALGHKKHWKKLKAWSRGWWEEFKAWSNEPM